MKPHFSGPQANGKASDKQSEDNLRHAQGGGITSKPEDNSPHDVFNTSGGEPVRDKEADPSKGIPITRYFTKDGTPVEPTTAITYPSAAEPVLRDDVIAVVEYQDEGGNTVTHDSLKASKEN